jgi:hypothetical protein
VTAVTSPARPRRERRDRSDGPDRPSRNPACPRRSSGGARAHRVRIARDHDDHLGSVAHLAAA